MRYHHLKNYMQEELNNLEQEIVRLTGLIRDIEHDRLHETTIKPMGSMTPEETMKKAEADRKRQRRIKDVQASASKRIADIRSQIGQ